MGVVAKRAGWGWTFAMLIVACVLSVFFMALTCKQESSDAAA